jgi:hypothetical protein
MKSAYLTRAGKAHKASTCIASRKRPWIEVKASRDCHRQTKRAHMVGVRVACGDAAASTKPSRVTASSGIIHRHLRRHLRQWRGLLAALHVPYLDGRPIGRPGARHSKTVKYRRRVRSCAYTQARHNTISPFRALARAPTNRGLNLRVRHHPFKGEGLISARLNQRGKSKDRKDRAKGT